jgi:uncharacterized protein (DUF2249 family)
MKQVTNKKFIDYSREITLRFLQTVVAVDDQLLFTDVKHKTTDFSLSNPKDSSGLGSADKASTIITPQKHSLNYQALSMAFAQKGIICGGFTPSKSLSGSLNTIISSSKNADVTILDWQMDELKVNNGQLATQAIIKLANNDISEGGRLRLITIYTGEDADTITDKLNEALKEKFNCKIEKHTVKLLENGLNHWKLEVINKNKKSEEQLAELLIDSFTELTAGL